MHDIGERGAGRGESPHFFSPHSLRVTVVTDLLNQNVPLEERSVLRRALEPEDYADLQSQAAARDANCWGADFDLRRRWLTNIFARNATRWWRRVTSIADMTRTATSNFVPSAEPEKKRQQIGFLPTPVAGTKF
jgi:hypothetical protein